MSTNKQHTLSRKTSPGNQVFCIWQPCAQSGMVSQAELVLRLGRAMTIRFLEATGVLSSGLSIARERECVVYWYSI